MLPLDQRPSDDPDAVMTTREMITLILFFVVQPVLFGAGLLTILLTPYAEMAGRLLPPMTAAAAIIAMPVAFMIAPRLSARYWRARRCRGDWISGPSQD